MNDKRMEVERAADQWATKMLEQIGMAGFGASLKDRLMGVAMAAGLGGDAVVLRTAMQTLEDLGL